MKLLAIFTISALGLAFVALPAGCSATATCDDGKCATGNKCIAENGGEAKCRLTCTAQQGNTGCPSNMYCKSGPISYCADTTPKTELKPGQFGTLCDPANGEDNKSCDGSQGFKCLATGPLDADAFCTKFGCTEDANCGGGFYCGEVNEAPNATTKDASLGKTRKVCLRRTFCSPCATDLDCGATKEGAPQSCVKDKAGKSYCMRNNCATDKDCPRHAVCDDKGICYPRAEVCLGKGEFCDPCQSDKDCGSDGACVGSSYSEEKSCAVKSASPCSNNKGTCPTGPQVTDSRGKAQTVTVLCVGPALDVPTDYCHGTLPIDDRAEGGSFAGCWSRWRR